jgi:hypothetical protein
MSIYLFCEGKTEKNIVAKFVTVLNGESPNQGKKQVNKYMIDTLGPFVLQPKPVRGLIMRDIDAGETAEDILRSITNAMQTMLNQRGFSAEVNFQPHAGHPNVYGLVLPKPDLRMAIHLATYKWQPEFINATIDDYVLDLALREATAAALLTPKQWPTTPQQIIRKVTTRIPALLQENGIPLREAKEYVRLYAAILQEHTSPSVFADKTVANAEEADKHAIFAALLAALGFLGAA